MSSYLLVELLVVGDGQLEGESLELLGCRGGGGGCGSHVVGFSSNSQWCESIRGDCRTANSYRLTCFILYKCRRQGQAELA